MANVLLGILAIVLFMGFAIGSAVFLGPRFDEAQSMGGASDAIQAVASVASSISAFRMGTGYAYGPGLETPQALVNAGFARRVPANPIVRANGPQIYGSNGKDFASSTASERSVWSPSFVLMSIGTDRRVCSQVMSMLGHTNGTALVSSTAVAPSVGANNRTAGCFRTSAAGTQIAAGDYVVYARIGS